MAVAIYKCNLCGYEHAQDIVESDITWDDERALDFVSVVVKRSDRCPNVAAGMIPKYFVCSCRPGQKGIAQFVGIRF